MSFAVLDGALRGAAAALLAYNLYLLARDRPVSQRRAAAAAFTLAVIAYLACALPGAHWAEVPAFVPILALCVAGPALFWLAVRAIFDDAFRWRAADAAWLALPLGLKFGGAPPLATLAASGSFVLAALWITLRHWRADLVEARRRFRAWITIVIALYLLVVLSVEMVALFSPLAEWLPTLNAAGITLLAFAAAAGLGANPSEALFPEAAARAPRPEPPETAAERRLRERLLELVERQHAYREEGLGIASLASRLATSEHTLRRLINQRLGYRNFNDFLHQYRLREARERLEREDAPVLSIALEVGYGSIGPFNRAFRQATGMTPTEYRAARRAPPAA